MSHNLTISQFYKKGKILLDESLFERMCFFSSTISRNTRYNIRKLRRKISYTYDFKLFQVKFQNFFWAKIHILSSENASIWVQDYPIELKFWENRFLRIRKPSIISDFLFETFSIFWSSPCTPLYKQAFLTFYILWAIRDSGVIS